MQGRDRGAAGDAGFTVVEIVVATAILLTVVTAAMGGIMFSSTTTMMNERRSEALMLANSQIELARNLPFDEVATVVPSNGLPAGEIASPITSGVYTVVTDVRYGVYGALDASRYKSISTVVSWDAPRAGSVTVSSLVAGASETQDYNFGTIVFKVVDEASPANPVVGVTVGMTDVHDKVYTGVTDTTGTVTFKYVPSGDVDFTGSKPGLYVDAITGTCYANQVSSPPIQSIAHPYRVGTISVRSANGNAAPAGLTVTLSGGPNTPSPTYLVTGADGNVMFTGLIKGTYNIALKDSAASARYVEQSSGTNKLTIGTSDTAMNLTAATSPVTVTVTLIAKGTVYCYNLNGVLNQSKATRTSSPYTATITLTNKDEKPTTYYFQKSSPCTSSGPEPITAGTTPVNIKR